MIDLKIVVVWSAEETGLLDPGTISDFFNDSNNLSFDVHIFRFQNRTYIELVVPFIPSNINFCRGVIGNKFVITGGAMNLDFFHAVVVDDLEVFSLRKPRSRHFH